MKLFNTCKFLFSSSEIVNYQAIICDKLAKCILEMDAEQSNLGVSVVVTKNKEKENLRTLFTARFVLFSFNLLKKKKKQKKN